MYYDQDGSVAGVEVCPKNSADVDFSLYWGDVNLLPETMADFAKSADENGLASSQNDYGIDIPALGLSYFFSVFDNDLNCRIDCVYVQLVRQ